MLFHRTSWFFNITLLIVLFMNVGMTRPLATYNYLTGEIQCNTRTLCLHEVAHKYDQSIGFVSLTKKYQHGIDVYRMMIWEYPQSRDKFSFDIYNYPGLGSIKWMNTNPFTRSWSAYSELFADIVQWSDGDPNKCPETLRAWYDWNYIDREMEGLGYAR
jgi:hypothetical protein